MNKIFSLSEDQLRQLVRQSVKDNLSEGIFDKIRQGLKGRGRRGARGSGEAGTETSLGTATPDIATMGGLGQEEGGDEERQAGPGGGRVVRKTIEELTQALEVAKRGVSGQAGISDGVVKQVLQMMQDENENVLISLYKYARQEEQVNIGKHGDELKNLWGDIACMAMARARKAQGATSASEVGGTCSPYWLDEWGGGGEEPTDPTDPTEPGSEVPKETPLSVTKRQKDVKVGAEGQKEAPLMMQLQKIGMSQASAQQIAKRIAQYLQQRKIPVAEGIQYILDKKLLESAMLLVETRSFLAEATNVSATISSIVGSLRNIMAPKAKEETKAAGAKYILGLHNVANQPDPEKFRAFLSKRYKSVPVDGGPVAKMTEDELKDLMKYVKTNPLFQKYHKAGKELRQAKADAKAQRRGEIRGVGADKNKATTKVVGKIISRFVSDNQELLDKDPQLQAIFDDPQKFNHVVKSVTNMLKRQFKRRGYSEEEYGKLLQEIKGNTYSFTNETDQDHSVVEKLAGNLYPYLKKQLKFNKDASIRLVSDPENGKNPLGKTAYYDPSSYAVTIYADNRHPKDILRSFSHEMVHHSQNCQGNFDNTVVGEQGYAQNDSHLREMERQAYEVGNLAFRDWEDGMKSAMMERIQAKLTENSQAVDQSKLKLALKEAINKDSLTKALFTG